jgi:rhamnulokinase
MQKSHYLTFDIGNSHVRLNIGCFNGKKLKLEEIYQFPNQQILIQDHLVCNLLYIYQELKNGLFMAGKLLGEDILGIGIDSWGVDYVLLDKDDNILSTVYHHTDHRTDGIFDEIFKIIPRERIYDLTGIQFINFNTLPQLYADKTYRPWILHEASTFLFIADFFNFLFTKKKYNEFTMASTSQFFNTHKKTWEFTILKKLSLPAQILQPIIFPNKIIENIHQKIKKECSLQSNIPVVAVASHDTASAIAAIPFNNKESNVYVSLGTWSCLGIELDRPNTSQESLNVNFTNECGIRGKILYHKILPGLWMFNQCINEWKLKGIWTNYKDVDEAASQEKSWLFFVNPNDKRFLNSINMTAIIKNYQQEKGRAIHQNVVQITRGIYESLALNYRYHIEWIERIIRKEIENIFIISGGSKINLLCQLTADITGKKVIAGLPEATTVGNLISQLIATGKINSWEEARKVIINSFSFNIFEPKKISGCEAAYNEFKDLIS